MVRKISFSFRVFVLLCLTVLLQAGCGEKDSPKKAEIPVVDAVNKTQEAMNDTPTDVKTVEDSMPSPPPSLNKENKRIDGYQTIGWEDLELPGAGMSKVLDKYVDIVEKTEEGSSEEESILEKMRVDLNALPVNPKWNNQKIRLPGFVSPLDIGQEKGDVGDFLLVPYFGACIHVPPPPMNQTVLVQPNKDKSINIEDIYRPVWVTGTLRVEAATTDLAEAGYQIENASLEMYEEE